MAVFTGDQVQGTTFANEYAYLYEAWVSEPEQNNPNPVVVSFFFDPTITIADEFRMNRAAANLFGVQVNDSFTCKLTGLSRGQSRVSGSVGRVVNDQLPTPIIFCSDHIIREDHHFDPDDSLFAIPEIDIIVNGKQRGDTCDPTSPHP